MSRCCSLVAFACALAVLPLGGCRREHIGEEKLEHVVDGKKVADVIENVRKNRKGGELVQRRYLLLDAPKDAVLVLATLDGQGFATGASYRREGPKGKRYTELTERDQRRVLFSRGDDETIALPDQPVVLLDFLHRLRARPNQDVVLLDLENATARMARIDGQGALVMPSASPIPTAGDTVTPAHTSKAPFLESATAVVVTWCRGQAMGDGPVAAAKALALATKPKLASERAGGPPSALMAVQIGGYDEAGAALVVACLRALEHPARVVSGRAGAELRTWAQVHDGSTWLDIDALDMDLTGQAKLAHAAYVEGFRGPLTTGLVKQP